MPNFSTPATRGKPWKNGLAATSCPRFLPTRFPEDPPFFLRPADAARYRQARPYFHPYVVRRITDLIPSGGRIQAAIDVGCGTGQSTEALLPLSVRVAGVDVSQAMLAEARRLPGVWYVTGRAAALPFITATFDLMTVGLALHWFDHDRFFEQAHRVLRVAGWLVIYSDVFSGTATETPAFNEWCRTVYLNRFPTPPRRAVSDPGSIAAPGFRHCHTERFVHKERFTLGRLVDYLMTQTNIGAALESGDWTAQQVEHWLLESLSPILGERSDSFEFNGWMSLLQREA